MSRRRKLLIAFAAGCALLVLFRTFILPGIIRAKVIEGVAKTTGRQASIERVSVNPFTLRATLDGFRMAEPDGKAVFASFSSLSVRLSTASILRRSLVVGDVTLVRPQVSLERVADNRYNFTDIVDKIRNQPESEEKLRFSINNIRVERGSIDFDDKASRTPAVHTVRDLSLAIPFISNIPHMVDRYVTPHFAATINNSPLELNGKLKPLHKSAETILTLKLNQLDLPHYLAYLPFEPGFAMPGGTLSTDLELAYRVGSREKPELNISGSINLAGVAFTEKKGAPLAALGQASAVINRWGVFGDAIDIDKVKLDRLDLHLNRDRQGEWNFTHLFPGTGRTNNGKPPEKPEKKNGTGQPQVKIADFALTDSIVHFRDSLPPGGFSTNLHKITLEAQDIATSANRTATWHLSCVTDAREELAASGTFGAEPVSASARVKLAGVQMKRYYPYLSDLLTAPVSGAVTLESSLAYTGETGLKLSDTSLTVTDLLLPFGSTDTLKLTSVAATGARVDVQDRQTTIGSVTIQRGTVAVTREADGTVSPQQLLRKPSAASPSPPARDKNTAAAKPFRYAVQNVTITGVDASFTDKGQSTPPTFSLKGITASLKNITGPKFAPIPFTLAAGYGSGKARITASGTTVPDPFTLKGQVTLVQIPLRDFDAYYPDDLGIFIAGGTVDTKINLDLAKKGDRIAGSYAGNFGVRSFYSLDTVESEDLLKWESLQIDNIRGTLEPFSLAVKDIALTSPFARVIVNRDGTLNMQHLGKAPARETAAPPTAEATQAPTQPLPPAAAPSGTAPVTIDTITIQDGTLAFIDRKLPGGFGATFFNLGGRVSGLSSESSRFAAVALAGTLENRSPLKISGTLNPLRGDLFMDLTVAFTDIELSPVTPYSGTYLGYSIDKGKLFLDLKYRIENKSLEAQNKLFIDQLTFGRKVESDKATNLPVRLAVGLLKDSKGEIHLDLPVTGRTDDPKFSVWKVVFQMLRNLLVKAATSPFSLLSSMLGGSEGFSSVTFTPGAATLTAPEQEKLAKLGTALKERPAISLEISGYIDRQKDPDGYRQEQLAQRIRNEKFLTLVKAKQNRPEDTPETMNIAPEEYSPYLKAVYRKEDFPKPRNAIGMIKDLPDAEMKKLLLAHLPAGDKELQGLARDRAVAVQSYLRDKAVLPAERLFLKHDDPFKAPEKPEQSGSRVEFGVVVK